MKIKKGTIVQYVDELNETFEDAIFHCKYGRNEVVLQKNGEATKFILPISKLLLGCKKPKKKSTPKTGNPKINVRVGSKIMDVHEFSDLPEGVVFGWDDKMCIYKVDSGYYFSTEWENVRIFNE